MGWLGRLVIAVIAAVVAYMVCYLLVLLLPGLPPIGPQIAQFIAKFTYAICLIVFLWASRVGGRRLIPVASQPIPRPLVTGNDDRAGHPASLFGRRQDDLACGRRALTVHGHVLAFLEPGHNELTTEHTGGSEVGSLPVDSEASALLAGHLARALALLAGLLRILGRDHQNVATSLAFVALNVAAATAN